MSKILLICNFDKKYTQIFWNIGENVSRLYSNTFFKILDFNNSATILPLSTEISKLLVRKQRTASKYLCHAITKRQESKWTKFYHWQPIIQKLSAASNIRITYGQFIVLELKVPYSCWSNFIFRYEKCTKEDATFCYNDFVDIGNFVVGNKKFQELFFHKFFIFETFKL